jgi:hypothetical protein
MNGITKVCTKSAVLPRKTPAGWIEMTVWSVGSQATLLRCDRLISLRRSPFASDPCLTISERQEREGAALH